MVYIVALDEGTSSTRALVLNCDTGIIEYEHQIEIESIFPNVGWVEMCPNLIFDKTLESMDVVVQKALDDGISLDQIKGVGITNQRETTVVWDKSNGKPYHNAIVWLDNRTVGTVRQLIDKTLSKKATEFQEVVGLPISPYFSAVKLRWLYDNIPEVASASADVLKFGTVDSWLIWKLTHGTEQEGVHVTDVTNASRTMLMNLKSLKWDDNMCEFFGFSKTILPEIKSSGEVYGYIAHGIMKGKPIAGCLGDQQAALFGQECFKVGEAKCTYGTGCFMLSNTGENIVPSKHGLLTTVAYQIGKEKPIYALEGAVAIGGEVVRWLRDNLNIIKTSAEIEELSRKVESTHDVYFVPAFSGLYAPYWDPTARGAIIGLTAYADKNHIARAALESVCYQVCEILDAMDADSGIKLQCLRTDGGMTKNKLFLDLQADILGIPVECRETSAEATALGAGMMAAKALGIWKCNKLPGKSATFKAKIASKERLAKLARWKESVQRCRGWVK